MNFCECVCARASKCWKINSAKASFASTKQNTFSLTSVHLLAAGRKKSYRIKLKVFIENSPRICWPEQTQLCSLKMPSPQHFHTFQLMMLCLCNQQIARFSKPCCVVDEKVCIPVRIFGPRIFFSSVLFFAYSRNSAGKR